MEGRKDGWKEGWMGGWMNGWFSRIKDCLQQSKNISKTELKE